MNNIYILLLSIVFCQFSFGEEEIVFFIDDSISMNEIDNKFGISKKEIAHKICVEIKDFYLESDFSTIKDESYLTRLNEKEDINKNRFILQKSLIEKISLQLLEKSKNKSFKFFVVIITDGLKAKDYWSYDLYHEDGNLKHFSDLNIEYAIINLNPWDEFFKKNSSNKCLSTNDSIVAVKYLKERINFSKINQIQELIKVKEPVVEEPVVEEPVKVEEHSVYVKFTVAFVICVISVLVIVCVIQLRVG